MVAQGISEPVKPVNVCAVCGKKFYTWYPYCSAKCARKAKRMKTSKKGQE